MFRLALTALFMLCAAGLAATASAQERPRTILVLDGSGSMWGQIDGVNKIVIAREVMGELLATLPEDQELGLTVYGHRRKGDCADIETVVAPGAGTRGAIAQAVQGINPRGKIPMTDAVVAAAEALRYTEEKATVILVSDGIETCAPDPCAAARVLEETGVDFTAHVVGFDVTDPEALAQMQCIADETGGRFLTAANASELGQALVAVAEPEPQPEPVRVSFVATEGESGPRIVEGIAWDLGQSPDGPWMTQGFASEGVAVEAEPDTGLYVRVVRAEDGASAERSLVVDEATEMVALVLPELARPVKITFRATLGERGPQISEGLVWTVNGPDGPAVEFRQDAVFAVELMPGDYTAEVLRTADETVVEAPFFVEKLEKTVTVVLPEIARSATLEAPETVPAGSRFDVVWRAEAEANDFVSVAAPDDNSSKWISYANTRQGNPAKLTAPLRPGTYELRYVARTVAQDILGTRNIEVTPVTAVLDAPAEAPAGAKLDIAFQAPGYTNDYLAVARPGDPAGTYVTFAYVRSGSPAALTLPLEPGDYELRYVMSGPLEKLVLTAQPLRVVEVGATLEAPAEAGAGSVVDVVWDGPANQSDYVSVARADDEAGRYLAYAYTRNGNPAEVTMPLDAGDYELRYVANGNPDKVLARRAIAVVEVGARLEAAAEAGAGSVLEVTWEGPDNRNDYVSIATPGADPGRHEAYAYTRNGNPAEVRMPLAPGEYELRYVANGNPDKVLATRAVTVMELGATLEAAAEAGAGSVLEVTWDGPDNRNDYVSIATPGADAGQYEAYAYTRNGNPAEVKMPLSPGEYELRYVANGNPDKVLATRAVTVVELGATLEAPAQAVAGSVLPVDWSGPDNRNDYVAVARPGADAGRHEAYAYTRHGSPAGVTMPLDPGAYELRYVANGNPDKVLATRAVEVVAAEVALEAAAEAPAGSTLTVDWTGPDNQNDYLAIARPEQDGSRYVNYTYTRHGSPASVVMPPEPGSYELRYVANGSPDRVLAARTVTVTPVSAALEAPETAPAGGQVEVVWQGPDYDRDYIAIFPQGAKRYDSYAYTQRGNPATVNVPEAPGAYEIRYVMQQGDTVLATRSLVVE